MSYTPTPIPIEGVAIPDELTALTERLAEHTHDLWSRQRMADGWTHGPERNDKAKTHPCLISYDRLPEAEKEYDRQTATGVVKAILALGYRIVAAPPAARDPLAGR